jgi:hypothetical protein
MIHFLRNLCLGSTLAVAIAGAAFAQTIKINNVSCSTGSVAFGSNEINITATGSCTSTTAVTPTITGLNPTNASPGTTVTATGTNFTAGATNVTVDGVNASGISVQSATSLTFVVPSVAAGQRNVVVVVNGVASNSSALTIATVAPVVTSLNPTSGPPGTSVTVTGTGFASGATATVGGINAPVSNVTATTLSILVPSIAAGSQPVVVTVGGTASNNTVSLAVTAATPSITSVAPTSVAQGASLTINGTGFAPGATVTIGGTAATVTGTPTATAIVVTVAPTTPLNAQVVSVTVAGVTANNAVTVTAPTAPVPTVTACTGNVSGAMTITGTNYVSGSTTATLNALSLTLGTVSATAIGATVPAGITVAGSYPLVVTVSGQSSSSFNCTIDPAVTSLPISTDKDGNPIPVPSRMPTPTSPVHVGTNGANGNFGSGGTENAWAVAVTAGRCANATPAITRIWYHNLDFTAYANSNALSYVGILANEALVYSFIAPPAGAKNNFNFGESLAGTYVANFMSISQTPCDFDTTKLGAAGGFCYSSRNGVNTVNYHSTTGAAEIPYCKLIPGQRYYINYRNQDAQNSPTQDSCQTAVGAATFCGGVLQIR